MKRILFGLGILLCLATSVFAENGDLYTFRLGKAFTDGQIPTVASIRFYTPASILNWIPVVRDMGLSVGTTLEENRRYMLGLSYELNKIVDLSGGWMFEEGTRPYFYHAVNLDISVFNQIVDLMQKVVE